MRARLFLTVAVTALLWRLLHLLALRDLEFFGVLGLDAAFYDRWARSLAEGLPQAREVYFQGPLYPYFLAGIYQIFAGKLLAAQLVQMLLGACTAGLAALVAGELFDRRVAWCAGLLYGFYSYAIFLETHLVAAPLLSLLLAAATYLMLRARAQAWQFALAGLLLGLAALGRGSLLVLAILAAAILLQQRRGRAAILLGLGLLVAILPVTLRNLRVGGEFVLLSANGGINYFIGNHQGASGFYEAVEGVEFFQAGVPHDGGSIELARERSGDPQLDAAGASTWWLGQGLRWQREHPLAAATLLARKLFYLWIDYEIPQIENFDWARQQSALLRIWPIRYGLLVALGLVGLLQAWRSGGRARALAAALVAFWLSIALFFVTARFRVLMVPALCVLAAPVLIRLLDALRNARWRSAAVPGLAALALAVISFAGAPAQLRGNSQQAIAYTRGVMAMQRGEYGQAARDFQQAVRERPDDLPSWANLGHCQEQLGQTELAIRSYEAALQLAPENTRVLEPLSTLLLRSGRLELAQSRLETLVRLQPQNAFAWASLGDLALGRGERQLGLQYWARVLEAEAGPDLQALARQRLESGSIE